MRTHTVRSVEPPRSPSDDEERTLRRLLSKDFHGRDALLNQLDGLRIKAECSTCVTVDFVTAPAADEALVGRGVPVEGSSPDADGVPIHVLLHADGGKLSWLEVYREDGAEVKRLPGSDGLRVTRGFTRRHD
jgi:hypothetical protein